MRELAQRSVGFGTMTTPRPAQRKTPCRGGARADAALGGDGRDGTRGVGKRAPHDEQTQRALNADNNEDGIVAYMRVAQRRDRTSVPLPSCPWTPARKRRQ
jgi:hypothetical protein